MVLAIVLIFRRVTPVNATSVALILLLAILYVSAFWGLRVSIFMSLLATLCFQLLLSSAARHLDHRRPSELGRALPPSWLPRSPPAAFQNKRGGEPATPTGAARKLNASTLSRNKCWWQAAWWNC